jgi:hypothetical protein
MVSTVELEARLLRPAGPERFDPAELDGLPEPARRHLAQAIAPGMPLYTSARLRMRGRIKVDRWAAGECFRYRITELAPVGAPRPAAGSR